MIGFGLLLCSSGGFGPGFWLFSPSPPPHKRIRILAPLYSSASCHLYPEARPSWNWYLQCCGSGIRDCVPFWPLYAGSSMNNAEDNLMSLKGIFWFVCGIRDGDSSDPVTVMVESRIRDKHLPDPPHWVPVKTSSEFKKMYHCALGTVSTSPAKAVRRRGTGVPATAPTSVGQQPSSASLPTHSSRWRGPTTTLLGFCQTLPGKWMCFV